MKSFIFCRNILGRQTLIWKINPMGLGEKTLTISHKPTCNPFKIPMLRVEQGDVKQTGGSWWHDLLSGHYQRQLGPLWPQKRGGRVVKMLASKAAAFAWRSRILLAVQKSAEAHYWVTGREKDTSLLFFLKQREILPWDLGSHTNPDLFLNKQRMLLRTDNGQRVLRSLLGTPLLQVFSDINLQKYSGIWRSREQNNLMETHIIAPWLRFNVWF